MKLSYSPIARRVSGTRDPKLGVVRNPWGYMLHTTGGGITAKAKRTGKTPIQVAIETYIDMQNGVGLKYKWGGPAYIIDHDGQIYQVAPDEIKTAHAGSDNRPHYLDGSWTKKVSPTTVAQWKTSWMGYAHPYALFPTTSPNTDYVGVEMIPIGDGYGGTPMAPGLRFTKAQHDAAITLGADVAKRHGWPANWAIGGRLAGHEDVDPIERSDANGGWDPGRLRAKPYFNFTYVRASLTP